MEDRCICCGEIIPEGMMACPNCLVTVKKDKRIKYAGKKKADKNILSVARCNVILALADSNMNVNEASRKLYMHRNTVTYQISRIKQLTGKDPLNFYDLHDLVLYVKAERNRKWMN